MEANRAEKLALELMAQHGLRNWDHLERFWSFKWDHARKRFGQCQYKTRTISLSKPLTLLNSEEQVTDTIKHEIAHALAGSKAKHGLLWRVQCQVTGARPMACYSARDVVQPRGLMVGTCPGCGHTRQAYRLLKRRYACASCCNKHAFGRFDARFEYRWTLNGAQQNAI